MAIKFTDDAPAERPVSPRLEKQRAYTKYLSGVLERVATGEIRSPQKNKGGRKKDPNAKQLLTLRLDPQVIEHFRSTGEGWQTRMNEALRKAAGL
jgi:uncharacterized protein (DUF4415 family)